MLSGSRTSRVMAFARPPWASIFCHPLAELVRASCAERYARAVVAQHPGEVVTEAGGCAGDCDVFIGNGKGGHVTPRSKQWMLTTRQGDARWLPHK